jgi:hypothetical protein
MRSVLLLAVSLTAVVLVGIASAAKPKPATVTISRARPTVVFGGSVKLAGVVSNHQAGESVTVLGRQNGTTAFTQVTVVTTAAKGAWSYMASPQIQTSYQARFDAVTSRIVDVKVRPRISLSLVSRTATRGTFSVDVSGNRPFTGKRVLVERLTTSGSATVKSVKLDAASSATFTIRLPRHHARVRVVMPTSQAAPGYIAGYSNVWKSS